MPRYTYCESDITNDPLDLFDSHFASSPVYTKKWQFHYLGRGLILNRVLVIHVLYAAISDTFRYTKCEGVNKNNPEDFLTAIFSLRIMHKRDGFTS